MERGKGQGTKRQRVIPNNQLTEYQAFPAKEWSSYRWSIWLCLQIHGESFILKSQSFSFRCLKDSRCTGNPIKIIFSKPLRIRECWQVLEGVRRHCLSKVSRPTHWACERSFPFHVPEHTLWGYAWDHLLIPIAHPIDLLRQIDCATPSRCSEAINCLRCKMNQEWRKAIEVCWSISTIYYFNGFSLELNVIKKWSLHLLVQLSHMQSSLVDKELSGRLANSQLLRIDLPKTLESQAIISRNQHAFHGIMQKNTKTLPPGRTFSASASSAIWVCTVWASEGRRIWKGSWLSYTFARRTGSISLCCSPAKSFNTPSSV